MRSFMYYKVVTSYIDDDDKPVFAEYDFYASQYNEAVKWYKQEVYDSVNGDDHKDITVTLYVVIDGARTILAQIIDRIGEYIKFVD